MSIRDEVIVHHMSSGELPRYSKEGVVVFCYGVDRKVEHIRTGDQFIACVQDVSGVFDHELTAEEARTYCDGRERVLIDTLVNAAKAMYPRIKDTDIEKYIAIRYEPVVSEKAAWEEVAPFITIPYKKAKLKDEISREDYAEISADWKEMSEDVARQIVKAMKKFGLHVVDASNGTDGYHLLISKQKITKKQAELAVWGE